MVPLCLHCCSVLTPPSALAAGGETGDLYVFVSVRDHPELRREGVTVHSDVGISYLEAILGGGRGDQRHGL